MSLALICHCNLHALPINVQVPSALPRSHQRWSVGPQGCMKSRAKCQLPEVSRARSKLRTRRKHPEVHVVAQAHPEGLKCTYAPSLQLMEVHLQEHHTCSWFQKKEVKCEMWCFCSMSRHFKLISGSFTTSSVFWTLMTSFRHGITRILQFVLSTLCILCSNQLSLLHTLP